MKYVCKFFLDFPISSKQSQTVSLIYEINLDSLNR